MYCSVSKRYYSPVAVYTTLEAKPESAPTNVGGGNGKVGDLVITWNKIPKAEWNGQGIGYRVYWKKRARLEEEYDMVGSLYSQNVIFL